MHEITRLGIAEMDGKIPPIPRGYSILLAGPSGSGKTIFGLHFLYGSATKYGERGIYISLRDLPQEVRRKAASIGFNISNLEGEGKIILVDGVSSRIGLDSSEKFFLLEPTYGEILRTIRDVIDEYEKLDRVVIDPISVIFKGRKDLGKVLDLVLSLSSLGITSLFISFQDDRPLLGYVFNGVIELENLENGTRRIVIRKMEGLRIRTPVAYPYEIYRGIGIKLVERGIETEREGGIV